MIQSLAKGWYDGLPNPKPGHPSFSTFKEWLAKNGGSQYLDFRSIAGPLFDAEMWFDEALSQSWRN